MSAAAIATGDNSALSISPTEPTAASASAAAPSAEPRSSTISIREAPERRLDPSNPLVVLLPLPSTQDNPGKWQPRPAKGGMKKKLRSRPEPDSQPTFCAGGCGRFAAGCGNGQSSPHRIGGCPAIARRKGEMVSPPQAHATGKCGRFSHKTRGRGDRAAGLALRPAQGAFQ
jgi:hypothetical protein